MFSGPGPRGRRPLIIWSSSGAAPSRGSGGGGDRRTGRSIRENPHMGAQGTRAIDVARRAGIVYAVHEYAHDERASFRAGGQGYALEAVAALGLDAARVFKTIVVAVDGRLGLAVVPADGEVDLKAVADALGGRRGGGGAGRRRGEGDRATCWAGSRPLGTRRPLPVVDRRVGRGGPDDPRVRRDGAAWRSSSTAADLVRLAGGQLAPIARAWARRST